MLIAQAAEASEVVRGAISHGWEAGLLAIVMVSAMGALSWVVKSWMNQAAARENSMRIEGGEREKRLGTRVDELENYIRVDLKEVAIQSREALERNTAAVTGLMTALQDRPCLLETEELCRVRQEREKTHQRIRQ